MTAAAEVVTALRAAGATVATAESLTGGLLCASLVAVPGASDVVAGGIVAYTPRSKIELLDVPAELIQAHGTVDARVAAAMASGVRRRLHTTWGLSTTGVAGPSMSEGKTVGTVHIGIAGPDIVDTIELAVPGDREQIRSGAVADVLSRLVARLREERGN